MQVELNVHVGKGRNVLLPCHQLLGDVGPACGPASLLPASGMLAMTDGQWVLVGFSAVLFFPWMGGTILISSKTKRINITPFHHSKSRQKKQYIVYMCTATLWGDRHFLSGHQDFQRFSQAAFLIKVVTYLKEECRKYLDLSSFCQSSPLGKEIMN